MRICSSFLAALLVAAIVPARAVAAADDGRGGLELKPALGFSWSDVTKDPVTGQSKAKVGWQLGGTVLFGEKLYVEGGAFYVKKSTDITATTSSGQIDFSGISGVRVPAMLGYHLVGRQHAPLAVRLFGGGSAFFVTSVDAQGLSKSDFESPSWGLFAGAGVDVLFLFADVKYEWSVTDVSNTFDVGKSRSLFVTAGLKLRL